MSLFASLGIASSALRTTQAAIQVVTDNVSNAQTAGYVRRTAIVAEVTAGNGASGSGTQIVGIERATAQALRQEGISQSAQSTGDAALSTLYDQLQDVTGANSGTPSISNAVSAFQNSWQTFEASPEDTSAAQQLTANGSALARAIGNAADGIEALATTAKQNVGTDIGTLNTDLGAIEQLNKQIVASQTAGISTAELQDQRDAKVADISKLVTIRTVARTDGSMAVYTPNGLALVDKQAVTLSWDGSNVTAAGSTASLNGNFVNGSIGATLGFLRTDTAAVQSNDPRLGALQKLRGQLDSYAKSFYDSAAATAPAFQAAYDSASPTNAGEQAASFFTTSDGSATATRFNLVVNPSLLNGTTAIKQAAGNGVVAALTGGTQSLNAGGLSLTGKSYAQIADAMLAQSSAGAATVAADAKSSSATNTALSARLADQTGVNMDDEMSKLIVLQNSYAAAARVVQSVNQMLTQLMGIGQ